MWVEGFKAAATAFGSLSMWFTESGVGLHLGLGNTHLKAGSTFFFSTGQDLKRNSFLWCQKLSDILYFALIYILITPLWIETLLFTAGCQYNYTPHASVYPFFVNTEEQNQDHLSLFHGDTFPMFKGCVQDLKGLRIGCSAALLENVWNLWHRSKSMWRSDCLPVVLLWHQIILCSCLSLVFCLVWAVKLFTRTTA